MLLTLAVLAPCYLPPRSAPPLAGAVEAWRLTEGDYDGEVFASQVRGRPLRFEGWPEFIGEGEHQALLLEEGGDPLVIDEAVDPATLPVRKLSVEAWVAVDAVQDWGGILGAIEDNGAHENGWLLGVKGPRFVFALAGEELKSLTWLPSETTYEPGRWYHVVGTYDGKVQRLYLDGELEAESRVQRGRVYYADEHAFVAGAYKDANEEYPLVGALHRLSLHDRALTASSVRKAYRSLRGKLPDPAGESFTGVKSAELEPLAVMQPAINAAIDRGVAHLLEEQHRDGSWENSIENYRNGQTALSVYTLIKSGLGANHPAVRRGLEFLARERPTRTYSAGFELLALGATGDPERRPWAEELVRLLIEWESDARPGSWAYPSGQTDLSNTQLVVLGLNAAASLGVEIPADVLRRMVEATIDDHQEEATVVADALAGRTGKRRVAGFTYYEGGATYPASGSMTLAGLCVLALAEDIAGKQLGRGTLRAAERASRLALDWMEHRWTVERNPGYVKDEGYYYYLYGIERVAAFFELEAFGEHDWYREGARALLDRQESDGRWGRQEETCFALLFLARATHPSSGSERGGARGVYLSEPGDVVLRAVDQGELVLYLEGFDEALLKSRGRAGLVLERVDYLMDGELLESVELDPPVRWSGERHAVRYLPREEAGHVFEVRVTARAAEGEGSVTLTSVPLEVECAVTPEVWMARVLESARPNLLARGAVVRATASSFADDQSTASRALDGLEATRWLCADDDRAPRLEVELDTPIEAGAVLLGPAASKTSLRGEYDRTLRLALRVNGGSALEFRVATEADELDTIIVPLPERTRVRRLEITILEREEGFMAGEAGFAEVGLAAGE